MNDVQSTSGKHKNIIKKIHTPHAAENSRKIHYFFYFSTEIESFTDFSLKCICVRFQ